MTPITGIMPLFLESLNGREMVFLEEADWPKSLLQELETKTGIEQSGNPVTFERREIRAGFLGAKRHLNREERNQLQKKLETFLKNCGRSEADVLVLPFRLNQSGTEFPSVRPEILLFWKKELPPAERFFSGKNKDILWKESIRQSLGIPSVRESESLTYELLGRKEGIYNKKFFVMRSPEKTVISALTSVSGISEKLKTQFFERMKTSSSAAETHLRLSDRLAGVWYLGSFSAEILNTGEFRMWSLNLMPLVYRSRTGRVIPLLRSRYSGKKRIRKGTFQRGDLLILTAGPVLSGETLSLQKMIQAAGGDKEKVRNTLSEWSLRTHRGRILTVFL